MSDDNETVQLPLEDEGAPPEESSVVDTPQSYNFQEFRESTSECDAGHCGDPDALRIEFAQQHISTGDVGAWAKGHLVSFEEPISSTVRIVLGGTLVGHGELIEVDGQVSIRVTDVIGEVQEKAA